MYTLFIYSHAFCHVCPCKYSSYTSRHMCSPFIYIQALCHICACMHSSYTSKHMYALFWPSFPVSVSLPVLGLGWLDFLPLAFPINSVFSLTPSISHLVFLCSESEILLPFAPCLIRCVSSHVGICLSLRRPFWFRDYHFTNFIFPTSSDRALWFPSWFVFVSWLLLIPDSFQIRAL